MIILYGQRLRIRTVQISYKNDHKKAWQELSMASRSYSNEQLILGQGDPVRRAGIVHSGTVRGEKLHMEGSSHVAYVYTPGEVFAFEGAVSGIKTSPLDLRLRETLLSYSSML